ncbi:alkyl sulfatase C-terminal domain-containing protein [Streptomyces sp. BK79]|uniref:alkyl sulfatase C-terminal domain-containing protein n=1 Tax=Streptomyces sp. BK79 TaxID=3350097 RepID=UPI00376FD12C
MRDGEGNEVRLLTAYDFLDRDCPDTANPGLSRQSRLVARHSLFEVVEGIYQVRGFDLPNMTSVEGERGAFLISGDPAKLTELLGHLTAPDPDFAIVTP